jgi:mono/diheme cytochrome c family protein
MGRLTMTPRKIRISSMTIRISIAAAGLVAGLAALPAPALAQRAFGPATEMTGKDIYEGICQGCHMPDARGAKGAGVYPALAGNKKLASKAYPALVVIRGQKAMPEFGSSLSDAQVANVVNYIRSSFGNAFTGAITPEEVKALRPVAAPTGTVRPPG